MSFTDVTSESSTTSTLGGAIATTFPVATNTDLEVTNISVIPNVVMTGAGTDYTPSGGGQLQGAGGFDTGTITLANPASGYTVGDIIRVRRKTPLTQAFDFANHSKLPGTDIEAAHDKAMMAIIDSERDRDDRYIALKIGAVGTSLATGTNQASWVCPYTSFRLYDVWAEVGTVATGATLLTLDVNVDGTTLFSTKITLDASEGTSRTAATPAVWSVSEPLQILRGEVVSVDIDAVGNTTPGEFAQINLSGNITTP